jgi:T3SS negative regulator,GrlR
MMQGEGTGVIELNDGKVTGGDTALSYTGSYVADGDKFTAFIATNRHSPGQPSVFGIGIDEVNLTLTGKSTPTTASCTGTAQQAPSLSFEAVLVRIADKPSNAAPQASRRGKVTLLCRA